MDRKRRVEGRGEEGRMGGEEGDPRVAQTCRSLCSQPHSQSSPSPVAVWNGAWLGQCRNQTLCGLWNPT